MFPISDTKREKGFPHINYLFIAINVVVFFFEFTAPNLEAFVNTYALIPAKINFSNYETLIPFVTAIFLHGGIFHIASNMWFLHIFGDNVEVELGHIKYFLLLLLTGIAGNFLQYILNTDSPIPLLGASGAVSGVLGAYMFMFPKHTIKSFVPLFFVLTLMNVPALLYIGYWFVLQLISGFGSFPGTFADQGGVAFFAHIGGFVAGFLLTLIFRPRKNSFIEGQLID